MYTTVRQARPASFGLGPGPRVSTTAMQVLRVPSMDGVVLQVQDRGVYYPPSKASSSESAQSDIQVVTMLLVHANGFHGHVWDPVVECLYASARTRGRGVRVLTFDLRAHGGSTVPDSTSSDALKNNLRWDKFADDVFAVVRRVKHTKLNVNLHVVGHSLGAHAAIRAEARAPGTFRSIYAFEPIFMVDAKKDLPSGGEFVFSPDLRKAASKRKERFESKAKALQVFKSKPPMNAFHDKALESYVEFGFVVDTEDTNESKNENEKRASSVCLAMSRKNEALVFSNGGEERTVDFLLRSDDGKQRSLVSCPTTVVRGSTEAAHDKTYVPYPSAIAPVVASVIGTNARLETHSEWNHFGPLCDPKGFVESVWEHVGRSEGDDSRALHKATRARL